MATVTLTVTMGYKALGRRNFEGGKGAGDTGKGRFRVCCAQTVTHPRSLGDSKIASVFGCCENEELSDAKGAGNVHEVLQNVTLGLLQQPSQVL